MAEARQAVERPLSPHLSIYQPADQHGDVDPASHHRRGALFRHAAAGGLADRRGHGRDAVRLRQRRSCATRSASSSCSATPGRCSTTCWAASATSSGTPAAASRSGRSTLLSWLTIVGSLALTLALWAVGLHAAGRAVTWAMRTPLAKVRGLGSAKEGTDHFWRQRLTAVANLVLVSLPDLAARQAGRRRPRHRQAHAGQAARSPSRCCCWCCRAWSTCGSACRPSSRTTCIPRAARSLLLMLNSFFAMLVGADLRRSPC